MFIICNNSKKLYQGIRLDTSTQRQEDEFVVCEINLYCYHTTVISISEVKPIINLPLGTLLPPSAPQKQKLWYFEYF